MKNDLRQKLHLEPKKGWLNDPNGLSFFGGAYRVYFQYSPDSPYGDGDKCWGYFEGRDLLDWKYMGAVIRPDIREDINGVYSGSGLVRGDKLYLFYTGNVKEDGDYDYITCGRGANVILVTTTDGRHMSGKRVLLRNSDYPEYCSCHVRDPKVWEENGSYRMVLGARTLEDKGCVLFYRSDDLLDWHFEKSVGKDDLGYMWECPDVIRLGGRRFLSISPQGLPHGMYSHQNVYSAGYFAFDGEVPREFEEWDYGFDFYAPQSFTAPDGRTLLIGWMGIGDIPYKNPTAELGWQHCLTIPRELSVGKNGRIIQRPFRELGRLKKEPPVCIAQGENVTAKLPFCFASAACEDSFSLRLSDAVELRAENGVFSLKFPDERAGGGRDIRRVKIGECRSLEVIADMTSLEIFLNGGEKVMSTRFYPDETALTVAADGITGIIHELAEMRVMTDENG